MPECPDELRHMVTSRANGAVGTDSASILAGLGSLFTAARRVG